MSENDYIERIEAVEEFPKEIPEQVEASTRAAPNGEHFTSLMQENGQTATLGNKPNGSLMDAVRDVNYSPSASGQVTHDKLVAQTQEAIAKIENIKETLESPNVTIKESSRALLQNKLTHVNESLQVAFSRAGVEFNPTEAVGAKAQPSLANPIERFLGFLTDGQHKLETLGHELTVMSAKDQQLTPVNMLAIQVKVGQIQQELELFSSLLNKALESVKTIMNIQV